MNQKNKPWMFALFFIICMSLLIPLPYYAVKPGDAHQVYELLDSSASKTNGKNGEWLFLTVKLSKMNILTYVKSLFEGNQKIIHESQIDQNGDLQSYLNQQIQIMKNAQNHSYECANQQLDESIKKQFTQSNDSKIMFLDTQIGGPSAGMMMCLGFLDWLTNEDLSSGLKVAGTGSLIDHRNVGDVGSVDLKITVAEQAGAELFIYPRTNQNGKTVTQYQVQNPQSKMKFCDVLTIDDAMNCLKNNSRVSSIQ